MRELAWPHVRAVAQIARLLHRIVLCAGDIVATDERE